MNHITHT